MVSKRRYQFLYIFFFCWLLGLGVPLPSQAQDAQADIKALTAQGWEKVNGNDLNGALADFEHILEKDPGNIEAMTGKARCLLYLNQLGKAEALYREILARNPDDPAAMLGLARAANWQGDYKTSAQMYEKVIRTDLNSLEIQKELAQVYRWLGQGELAEKQYHGHLMEDPRNKDILRSLEEVQPLRKSSQRWSVQYLTESDVNNFKAQTIAYRYKYSKALAKDKNAFIEAGVDDFRETGKESAIGEVMTLGGNIDVNKSMFISGAADVRGYSEGLRGFFGGNIEGRERIGIRNLLTARIERTPFDVLDDRTALQYSIELKTDLIKRLQMSHYYRWADISDENSSAVHLHTLSYQLPLGRPNTTFSIGYRNNDYKDTVTAYYSPQDLQSVIYSLFSGDSFGPVYIYGLFKYLDNSDHIDNYYYLAGGEYAINDDMSVALETTYFDTTAKYHALGTTIFVQFRF